MVSVRTKAELANVKENSQMKPPDCAASTVLTVRPMRDADPAEGERERKHDERAGNGAPKSAAEAETGEMPTPGMIRKISVARMRSEIARPSNIEARDMGSDWNAVEQALLHVVGHPDSGRRAVERQRLHEDPGHQVVDVVRLGTADIDGATEHISEQQHEQHRLHDREDEQVRHPDDLLDQADRHHPRVAEDRAASRRVLADGSLDGKSSVGRSVVLGWRIIHTSPPRGR